MAEQAGRLEVEVVSNLRGFAEKLRLGVEKAAEGVKAKIGVEVDHKLLRERLELAVKEASAGVNAKIGVKIDRDALRRDLEQAMAEAGAGDDVKVKVKSDDHLSEDLRADRERAQLYADGHPVEVKVEEKKGWLTRFKDSLRQARQDAEKELGGGSNSSNGGFWSGLWSGFKTVLSKGKIPALLSLLQPAIGVVSSLGAGLVTLGAGIAQAAGAAGAALPAITSFAQGLGTFKLALGGTSTAFSTYAGAVDQLHQGFPLTQEQLVQLNFVLKKLSPSARSFVTQLVNMRPQFLAFRKSVQESFFSKFVGDLHPLVNSLLPLLTQQLSTTGSILGGVVHNFATFFQTTGFHNDLASILSTDNGILSNLGSAALSIFKIFVKLTVAAGPLATHISAIFAVWTAKKAQEVAQNGKALTDFFNRAGKRAGQLYKTVRDFALGLYHIGVIALQVDGKLGKNGKNGLFGSMQRVAAKFREFTQSANGQNKIAKYFQDMLPIVTEVGHLIRTAFDGLVNISTVNHGGLLGALKSLTKIGGPAKGFLTQLSAAVGPLFVKTVSSFFAAVGAIGQGKSASSFTTVIRAVLSAIKSIADYITAHPTLAKDIGYLLGSILAYKVLKSASKWSGITTLTKALGGLFGVTRRLRAGGGLRGLFSGGGGIRGFLGRLRNRGANGGGGGLGGLTEVFWTRAMPVYIVGGEGGYGGRGGYGGGRGGVGGPYIGGGGGGLPGEGEPRPGGRLRNLGRGLRRGAGGAAGLALLLGGQYISGAIGGKAGTAGGIAGSALQDGLTGAAFGSMFGPEGTAAGAIIGALYGGISNWLEGKNRKGNSGDAKRLSAVVKNARTVVAQLALSIVQAGGKVTAQTKAIAANAVAHSGLIDQAAKAGLTEKDLTNAVTGSKEAYDKVVEAWKNGSNPSQQALATLAQLRGEFKAGKPVAQNYADAHGIVLKAERKTGSMTALLSGHLGKFITTGQTAQSTSTTFSTILGSLTDTVKANGRTLDLNTSFGQDNAKAIRSAASAAIAHAQAVYRQTGNIRIASGDLQTHIQWLEGAATAAGLDKDQVHRLIDKLIKFRGKWRGQVVLDAGAAQRAINNLNQSLTNYITSLTTANQTNSTLPGYVGAPVNPLLAPLANTKNPPGGKHAIGGRVRRGLAALVGEQGEELFVPDQNGTIVPHGKTMSYLSKLRAAAHTSSSSAHGLSRAADPTVVFEDGAIKVFNPSPEPASTSVATRVRAIGAFGLFGGGAAA